MNKHSSLLVIMLGIIMLNVVVLSIIMLNVVILIVVVLHLYLQEAFTLADLVYLGCLSGPTQN
jgi:hypothetical protein